MSDVLAQLPPQPQPQPRPFFRPWLLWLALGLAALVSAAIVWWPNHRMIPADSSQTKLVLFGQETGSTVLVQNDEVLLPVPLVRSAIDPYLYWDEAEKILIVTGQDRVLAMATDQLTAYLNNQALELNVPVTTVDGTPYMAVAFLAQFYDISVVYSQATNRVVIERLDQPRQLAAVVEATPLRYGATRKAPILSSLPAGAKVTILEEKDTWFHVQTADGLVGYLPKRKATLAEIAFAPPPVQVPRPAWSPLGQKINLTWEQVNSRTPDPASIGALAGLNVISPTWFYLANPEGLVGNRADLGYVNWAHRQGYQVWGLFSNSFDRDLTHQVLASTATRTKIINQILALAALYQLDGINIDFENMLPEDKPLLVQFVRELTPLAHEQDLTVSIDVTVKSSSANWSLIYDRAALAKSVDYVILMTYDEHWADSPAAGSVASLPWVEKGLQGVLQEVPPQKLLLGIPFYTRLWEEKIVDGQTQVTSRAISMEQARALIKANNAQESFDVNTGQNFATYARDGATYKIWLEDGISLEQRAQLVRKYGLAGIASWRRGFESEDTWQLLTGVLEHRP